MTQTIEWKKTQPGSTEAVQFTDGMLVTADDLTAAMRYPLAVVQVLLKAWFGCGVVCGLDLRNPAAGKGGEKASGEAGATGTAQGKVPEKRYPNFILTVEKGVALGCDGYPIEICGPLKLDLTPDPCRLDRNPQKLFIAARRVTAAEAAARPCGCAPTGGEPAQQCTRMRDHALVQAFDQDHLPADICRTPAPAKESGEDAQAAPAPEEKLTGTAAVCACVKQCGECACCGEPWVLLGSVWVGEQGLDRIDTSGTSGRRWVKPIACACAASERSRTQAPTETKPKAEDMRDPATGAQKGTATAVKETEAVVETPPADAAAAPETAPAEEKPA